LIQGPVAASQSGARIRNPLGSNRLVVFEKISFGTTSTVAGAVSFETQTTNLDLAGVVAAAANLSWDKRLNVGSALVLSVAAPAAALSLARQLVDVPASAFNYDFIVEEQQEVILSPGEAIQIRKGTVNENIDTTWWWRERKFEPEELNF
jgi:hypothetical protein